MKKKTDEMLLWTKSASNVKEWQQQLREKEGLRVAYNFLLFRRCFQ